MDTTSVKNYIRIYQRPEVIFQNNSVGKEMYIIRSGKVRLLLGATRGEAEVGTLERPGEFFGEMALIDGSPRSATAVADEDNTELEIVDRERFLEMIRHDPEFALDLMRELSQRVRLGNILYLEVIKGAMTPFCRQNCLGKTMDAFARQGLSPVREKPGAEVSGISKWRCDPCDYIYIPEFGDPQSGIYPGTPFENLPDTWVCPECGAPKSVFEKIIIV